MKLLQLICVAGALAFAEAAMTQVNEPPVEDTSQTTESSEPSNTESAEGTPTRAQVPPAVTPGTSNPAPSTRQTEGTAADRSPPGATTTRPADPGTVNPVPATSRTEGTAADRTPPGETPVRGTASSRAPEQATSEWGSQQQQGTQKERMAAADIAAGDRRSSVLVGKGVYSQEGALLGEVKDLVIDPMSGRVTHAVVATGGSVTGGAQRFTAVPWNTITSGMHHQRIVMDQTRLNAAPNFAPEQWPDLKSGNWSDQADQYWKSTSETVRK
jgi:sporulation protein YlmC with PRC-barrel domain